ncbi:hypothetical protein COY07_03945 [Candidatus Peregrinibacteria bacterium CG_4_10_14_0_2_um_filter_43_11]|nr:MAG: hypothetical protein COY07_03945 [Candidatus Peregrinibacteria bacterium CG_4_10_14_0_2_um_filter_43_11]
MKKILLFGHTGFIGSHFLKAFGEAGFEVIAKRIEIRDYNQVKALFEEAKPDMVMNATGVTGKPNVDWCETNPIETLSINVAGSINIASIANGMGVYMAQLSSGCVYNGEPEGGYKENDEPDFFGSLYSRSRVLSEKALKEFSNVLQLRVRIPILGRPHPKNLIDKMLKYPKMINKRNSCTVIEDFIPASMKLIEMGQKGIFNMTNIGAMNHEEIMTMYKEIVDPNFQINLMPKEEEDALCIRRSNCVLSTDKREELGVHMPPLTESLRRILEDYKRNAGK